MLMDSFIRDGPAVSVPGGLLGAIVLWQAWGLLQRGSHQKATAHKDLDVESGVKAHSDSVSLRVFSTELPPAVNGWACFDAESTQNIPKSFVCSVLNAQKATRI